MRERGCRRRIGEIVGRNIDRLHRCDRAFGSGGDALLQRAHVGGERRLVAHRRGDAAEQRRHFRAGLREPENVVDEKQHVLALVAEIFGDRQSRQADAGARAGRLIHLAIDQRAFRTLDRTLVRVLVDPRLDHLVIEVVALAGALADAGEYRIAAVRLGDVIDQLHDDDGLADAGAAEQADLAALGIRRQQVDDLDAGHQDRRLGRLIRVERRVLMNGAGFLVRHRAGFVDRVADHINDAAERAFTDRHQYRLAGVGDLLAAHQTFGGIHGDGAHGRFAKMLSDLKHQAVALILGIQRVEDRRQMILELHVDDGADDLRDTSDLAGHLGPLHKLVYCADAYRASAPEMISISSLVIIAWRVRL